ncbi:hypothetical protein K402DRAFT_393677 [Aulographum hederae CBS 113979]|uniref:Survival motor neuron Tudor domain-containing protein n=1 Tax=Aulographum hederae CBS 113979 TaxID=1176131 RepID=A0A6G1H0L8_9PEZI|nr:hypothetical protein K402DRAFT_393677 [Aulographum hederae CBS 113979]
MEDIQIALDQTDDWDDSALVDNWDAALEEYKQYHSIAARGEDPEEILAKFEAMGASTFDKEGHPASENTDLEEEQMEGQEEMSDLHGSSSVREALGDMPMDSQAQAGAQTHGNGQSASVRGLQPGNLNQSAVHSQDQETPASPQQAHFGPSPRQNAPMPDMLLANIHDQGLRNIMASWYYVGYYTGLYAGQQAQGQPPN